MDVKEFESKVWLASPTMHGEEIEYVKEAYETNWMSTVGENINEVEKIAAEKAEADAETIKIKAEAEAQANKVLSESITTNVIEYNKIEKWNGELPQVTGGSGTLINLD